MRKYMTPITTKVSLEARKEFEELSSSLGTTPAGALRMLIFAFNDAGGFPYAMRDKLRSVPGKMSKKDYSAMLDHATEQIRTGRMVTKTMDELDAIVDG
jgi:hypothetical protein